jgi:hypothetical protein
VSCDHAALSEAIAAGDWRVSWADENLPLPRACISCEAQFGEGAPPCEHCWRMLLPYRRRHVWAWCRGCDHWVRTAELRMVAA